MTDTVVIEGEVSLINQIDGDPDVCIGTGGGVTPTGTKSILLTEAGTKTEDVTEYAYAEVNAVKSATASGAVASFSDGAEDVPMDSCLVNIEPVQSGSGDPSPSNVRPISGWDTVKVYATGVKVWDEQWENGSIQTSTGEKASGSNVISKNYIPVRPNTTFSTTVKIRIFFYKADKTYISYVDRNAGATFTTPSECYYLLMTAFQAYGSTYNNDISINYPSTDTTYHAYTGTSYPISLGQTVYGGTLDVVSGVLTVTWGTITLNGSETWGNGGSNQGWYTQCRTLAHLLNYSDSIICDRLKTYIHNYNNEYVNADSGITAFPDNSGTYPNDNWIYAKGGGATTGEEFKAWLASNPLQVVYLLKTPTTAQLTPTEVKTLLGSNSIWADSGDISVGYKADIFLYAESLETIIDTLTGGA